MFYVLFYIQISKISNTKIERIKYENIITNSMNYIELIICDILKTLIILN